jgi:hypothetical protein
LEVLFSAFFKKQHSKKEFKMGLLDVVMAIRTGDQETFLKEVKLLKNINQQSVNKLY